jgi:UPF0271 protein
MVTVDLNADLGEGETVTTTDLAVLHEVTSVSIACGFHAGNPMVMEAMARACVERGLTIGAHVSYRDRVGFGRRVLAIEPDVLAADIVEQGTLLGDIVRSIGGTVAFVKPHGALYNQMGVDPEAASVVVSAVARLVAAELVEPRLVAQAGTRVVDAARESGLTAVSEGFPDRGYSSDGRLAPRQSPGGLVAIPGEAGRRAVAMVVDGGVESVDGRWTAIRADTLCIHGDAPDADHRARAVRSALQFAGISLRPFAPAQPATG